MADSLYGEPDPSLVSVCQAAYLVHAIGLALMVFSSVLYAWLPIAAVAISYLKRRQARQTWLESHFTSQIRTFWFGTLWGGVVVSAAFLMPFMAFGAYILIVGLSSLGIWAIYRVARGWIRLRDRKPVARLAVRWE